MPDKTRDTATGESDDSRYQNGLSVIIAGSRSITELGDITSQRRIVTYAIETAPFVIGEVVSGTARGVDQIGEDWATHHDVPIQRFSANWDEFGRSAGPRRNKRMADYADALVAVHVNESPGTADMIDTARDRLRCEYVHVYKPRITEV